MQGIRIIFKVITGAGYVMRLNAENLCFSKG
jgi:hypothetical protein